MQALVHTIADACAVARVGKTAIYEAINSGKLPARKQGRRTLIFADDLRRFLDALPLLVPAKSSQPRHNEQHGSQGSRGMRRRGRSHEPV